MSANGLYHNNLLSKTDPRLLQQQDLPLNNENIVSNPTLRDTVKENLVLRTKQTGPKS